MDHNDPESRILASWQINAAPWARAIRNREITSRETVTHQAIVDAVVDQTPATALDAGCGEGWLVRALQSRGITTIGTDATPALIDQARRLDTARYEVMDYDQLARTPGFNVDLVVCNFALIGEQSTHALFRAARQHLAANGKLVIQTLHPLAGLANGDYVSGWREGSWDGFSADFTDPAPWYFRTLGDWIALFGEYGLTLTECREPAAHPGSHPLSILFVARLD